ncbi:hypothetical protein [Microbacterium hominis]|uniref:hypothetical protein n=1 Tax=Microbacterium hominis TaxID=162426 RepID=UPI00168B9973|nr:hypothetical protein [Microbacterium hominis]QOC25148.1 hypothetical protein IC745_12410 [Microbacterium hominis]
MNNEVHQLELEPLTSSTWRLIDQAVARCDAGCVLAYVEQRPDGRYEATWVATGIATRTYASTQELLSDAVALVTVPPARPYLKPVPIPHRRPPVAQKAALERRRD